MSPFLNHRGNIGGDGVFAATVEPEVEQSWIVSTRVPPAVTVTVAFAVAVPPVPVHERPYTVVTVGETEVLPLVVPEVEKFVPVQLVAFVLDQVRVDELPKDMVVGRAVSDAVGAGATVRVALAVAAPLSQLML